MWLFIAILFSIQAPANSEDAIKQEKALNPEAFMNVVSQENFEFPLCLKVCGRLAGGEGDGGYVCGQGTGHHLCWFRRAVRYDIASIPSLTSPAS